MSKAAVVEGSEAAGVFSHRRQRGVLMALLEKDLSSSELARLTGTPLNLLHHYLAKFIRLGLIVITRVEARAGAPIKFYQAIADSFFVPADLMDKPPSQEMNAHLRAALERGLARSIEGVRYSSKDGRPLMRVVKSSGEGALATEIWLELRLSRSRAVGLANDLLALLKTYETGSNDGDQCFIVHAVIAPG